MSSIKNQNLLQLQNEYITRLPAKLDSINCAWKKTQTGDDNTAITEFGQLIHNLAGSAGTFGFPTISSVATKLEVMLKNIDTDQTLNDEETETIDSALQEIKKLVDIGPTKQFQHQILEEDTDDNETENNQLIYAIENNQELAKEIVSQLKHFDYEVETFSSIAKAIDALKHKLPAAMIIDVQLPEGEFAGPDFALLFNQFSRTHVPSIFISNRDDWHARLAAIQANGNAYLTKPLDFNDLLEHLDKLTNKQAPEPFRVLVVDDMKVLAEHYALVLRHAGMQVKVVTDINDLLEVLSDFQPELILMDIYMPECSGLEAAKIIRQKNELLSVPIVFLSTETSQIQHASAMELGGDDFLQKPIQDDSLLTAVRTRAQRFRQLRSHMNHDGLTGLLNHVNIKTHLESEIARAQRQHADLSFAMIDIDDFKQVNDTYGHPVGDRVIKSVARMLKSRLRRSDLIGRYGGEEFAIILPQTDIKTAKKLLDDVRENFSQIVQQTNEVQFSCTFSVGVTQLFPSGNSDDMINDADEALYEAKNTGKNKVCQK